jgi:hypothetical protein
MPHPRDFFLGPWRAVSVLGVTQILAWGILFYPPVLMMPLIAADRGWSLAFAMGGFSLALLVSGFVAPTVGGWIDRFGGHVVMAAGSLVGAVGLVLLVSRLCDARPHFRRGGAATDHGADFRRRLCIDCELASHAVPAEPDGLAHDVSDLCRRARFRCRAAARLRAAARPRGGGARV